MLIYYMFPKIYIHFEDMITNFTLNFECILFQKSQFLQYSHYVSSGVVLVSPFFLTPDFDAYFYS